MPSPDKERRAAVRRGEGMGYFEKRDQYLDHIRGCKACVSTFSGKRYFADERGVYKSKFSTVSLICKTARALLDAII